MKHIMMPPQVGLFILDATEQLICSLKNFEYKSPD